MSYQRAVVNCKRCYTLAQDLIGVEGITDRNFLLCCFQNDSVFQARNEAMRALEQEIEIYEFHGTPQKSIENLHKALSACMNCAYKKPVIAEMFQPADEEDGSV